MPDNIEYMYMGYAAMAIILFGMIGWIYWRYRMASREEQMIEQFEAEERAQRAAKQPTAARTAAPDADAAPAMTGSPLSKET